MKRKRNKIEIPKVGDRVKHKLYGWSGKVVISTRNFTQVDTGSLLKICHPSGLEILNTNSDSL